MTNTKPHTMSLVSNEVHDILERRTKRKTSYRQNQDQAGTDIGEVQPWAELDDIADDVKLAFSLSRREHEAIKLMGDVCLRWWRAVMDVIDVQTRRDDMPLEEMVTVSLTLVELAGTIYSSAHQIQMLAKMNEMTEMANGLNEFMQSVEDIANRLEKVGMNLNVERGDKSRDDRFNPDELERMLNRLSRKFQA